jgi:hypothetical protein
MVSGTRLAKSRSRRLVGHRNAGTSVINDNEGDIETATGCVSRLNVVQVTSSGALAHRSGQRLRRPDRSASSVAARRRSRVSDRLASSIQRTHSLRWL